MKLLDKLIDWNTPPEDTWTGAVIGGAIIVALFVGGWFALHMPADAWAQIAGAALKDLRGVL